MANYESVYSCSPDGMEEERPVMMPEDRIGVLCNHIQHAAEEWCLSERIPDEYGVNPEFIRKLRHDWKWIDTRLFIYQPIWEIVDIVFKFDEDFTDLIAVRGHLERWNNRAYEEVMGRVIDRYRKDADEGRPIRKKAPHELRGPGVFYDKFWEAMQIWSAKEPEDRSYHEEVYKVISRHKLGVENITYSGGKRIEFQFDEDLIDLVSVDFINRELAGCYFWDILEAMYYRSYENDLNWKPERLSH